MFKVYSRVEPNKLLHVLFPSELAGPERTDICPDEEFLQVACFTMPKGKTFRPHYHIPNERVITITQECWVVVRGVVCVSYYDLDGTLLQNRILHGGDCTVTFAGGHTYECLKDDTCVFEIKGGPYLGQAKDKAFYDPAL